MENDTAQINSVEALAEKMPFFLDELRKAGYSIGTGEYLSVQRLLLRLADKGCLTGDIRRAGAFMGPLLCTNEQEQQDFTVRFNNWIAQFEIINEDREQPVEKLTVSLILIIIIAMIVLRFGIDIILFFLFQEEDVISPENQQSSDFSGLGKLHEIIRSPFAVIDLIWKIHTEPLTGYILPIAGIIVIFLLIRELRLRYLTNAYMTRHPESEPVETRLFHLKKPERKLFQSITLFHAAQKFRKHLRIEDDKLDVDATVEQTAKLGGWFSPVWGYRQITPEYLVLVDRTTFLDHQAGFLDTLVNWLTENNVFVKRYYFDGDPRSCVPEKEDAGPFNLIELAGLYPEHRLLILSDGTELINPFTGKVVDWIDQFYSWKKRALLTLESIRTDCFHIIANAGFIVKPANESGLKSLIDVFNDESSQAETLIDTATPLPDMFREHSIRWHERRPPEPAVIDEMLEKIRLYLGKNGYDWFSACAVYPEINWNLTIHLGNHLKSENGNPIFSEETLSHLARLPWFRYGRMPDWLRNRLIGDQSNAKNKQVRMILFELFHNYSEKHLDNYFALKSAWLPEQKLAKRIFAILTKKAHKYTSLKDRVFVTFMKNSLSVRIPNMLGRFFREKTSDVPETYFKEEKEVETEQYIVSDAKINIFALPNQTSVIIGLIVIVVLGTVFMGTAITNKPILWNLQLALFILPLRAFLSRPERFFSHYEVRSADVEFADLQTHIIVIAQKIGLSKIPRLSLSLKINEIVIFGTFRHWYIVVNENEANKLQNHLRNPETAPMTQAKLIHELYHFKTGDHWQLGYVYELLRITFLLMLWALMFFPGFLFLLNFARPDIINFDPPAEWINRIPSALRKLFATSNIMETFLQKLGEPDSYFFYATATFPFIIMTLILWMIYPKLWRIRDFYADAGVVREQKEVAPFLSAMVSIPLPLLRKYPPFMSGIRSESEYTASKWVKIRRLLYPARTSSIIRLKAVENPSIVYDNWEGIAVLAGILALVSEISLSTPLTAEMMGKAPLLFPTLAVLILVSFNYLIPYIAQGKPVKGGILKIICVIMLLRLLITFLIFSISDFDPALLRRLDIVGPSKAPPFHDAEYFVTQLMMSAYVQVFVISLVLLGALASVALLLRRIFTWYGFFQIQHSLVKISYWTIALVSLFLGVTVLPLISKTLSYLFPLFHLASFDISIVILGIIITLASSTAFWYTDKKYAHRCPECNKTVPGPYILGKSCCGKLLHPWLIAEY
ncbi:MAG: hypothetical protein GY749_38460 [Desulfobacteraceae bacterium]|nr:hypothetical protein [Desulfobacteraceae bacterium]